MGLLLGERVVSGMSLGRKNSMYGSFKGAPHLQKCLFMTLQTMTFAKKMSLSNTDSM